ncbi:hypothetical protein TNCV_1951751 [Trichonephila clavipes]|nr:hypothetical protein TNCV_1951751 [Trichonephila clavipes]
MFNVFIAHIKACLRIVRWMGTHIAAAQCDRITSCRQATKSICAVTTSPYTNALRWLHTKKPNGGRFGDIGGPRTVAISSFKWLGYAISTQPREGAQKCTGAHH